MNIVIVEDERLTAKDLEEIILEVEPSAKVLTILTSVRQAVQYFQKNPTPDLLFCDIQLGDGLSFEIFTKVQISVPIVFCTAFDQYALDAFKLNGIDYVLKPFTASAIEAALRKYKGFSQLFGATADSMQQLQHLIKQIQPTAPSPPSQLLVHHKEKIIPVKWEDIALFYIDNQVTYLYAFNGTSYYYNKTLDQLEQMVGTKFFRANRQMLVNRTAVKDASHHLSRKFTVHLNVPFEQSIMVSKEKLPDFLNWLSA